MTLDQLTTFTISDDHEAQERIWFEGLKDKLPRGIRRSLTKTLVERHFTCIDWQVEELEEGGFLILVGRECESVGSREPARRLRNKLMAMLPDLGDQPLIFDLSEVRDPSSSFLDELFGLIALQTGLNAFTRRCSLEGISAASIDRANAVMGERQVDQGALFYELSLERGVVRANCLEAGRGIP